MCGFFFLDDFADPEGISKFANPPGCACVMFVLNSCCGDMDESIVLILLPVELPATVGLKI